MDIPRVGVVGAGLAGLAAASELKRCGLHVEIFERSRLLGGRATSFELDGHVVDNGQHVFLGCCTEFIRFVEHCGMSDALYLQPRFEVVSYTRDGTRASLRAAALPAPLHLLASFAAYANLSLRAKLHVTRALLSLRMAPKKASDDISFAQWLDDRGQGREAIEAFWDPFLVPALNAPLDRMSAADAAFVLSTAFLRDAGAARFGFSKVPLASIMDRASQGLDAVHRSTTVFSAKLDRGRALLKTANDAHEFDAVVFAVSPRALARVLPDYGSLAVRPLDVYEAFAIMDVHLWYDGGDLEEPFAALLGSPVQWVFQKGAGYLCGSISSADEFVSKPSTEMVALAWDEVRRYLPQLRSATLRRGAATRNPEGTFLSAPGAPRPGPRTTLANVAIAGAWTATGWPDTMESAVRSGIAAAQVLLESNLVTRETSFA